MYIGLKGRMMETEMRDFDLICSPDAYKNRGLANTKPGTRNSICIFSMGGRKPTSWAITSYFPV